MAKYNILIFAGALFFLLICNFNPGIASAIDEIELHILNSELAPNHEVPSSFGSLRRKRETMQNNAKNQYESVPQNTSATGSDIQKSTETGTASIVPYNAADRPLLGVNGTGQRLPQQSTAVVSGPIQTALGASAAPGVSAKPVQTNVGNGSSSNDQSIETSDEKLIDNVDVPSNETLSEIGRHNYTVNSTNDYHAYYNSSIYVDKVEADRVWNRIKNITFNAMLSQSHRRAMTVELSFKFPFYGHPVQNVTVATGGFLYSGDYVHSWLAATQYIAPLMANFDTSLSNESFVRIQDNGTALTVVWEKVSLQDKQSVGKFTFSATLHSTGDIVFIYYNIPIDINAIQDDKHPVKVGLSDAYIIDKIVYNTRRKTIFEYHRVNLSNNGITNATIIYLKALPTCLDYKDCAACSNHKTAFDCAWCPTLNRCSTGTDRKKQDWTEKGCERIQISDASACPPLGSKGNDAKKDNGSSQSNSGANSAPTKTPNVVVDSNNSTQNTNSEHLNTNNATNTPTHEGDHVNKIVTEALEAHPEPKRMGLALGFLIPICMVLTAMLWVLYAYRNPHTKSGQLLIQFRPSQWSWRRGEARYTAATIHM